MFNSCYTEMSGYVFFFFKQKTAYEMRISDWSSDVCSSDLVRQRFAHGSLYRLQAIGEHRREDPHEPAIGIVPGAEPSPKSVQGGRQIPVLERCAVTQRAGLVRDDRQLMPGIVYRPIQPNQALILPERTIPAAYDTTTRLSHARVWQERVSQCRPP